MAKKAEPHWSVPRVVDDYLVDFFYGLGYLNRNYLPNRVTPKAFKVWWDRLSQDEKNWNVRSWLGLARNPWESWL